MRSWRGKGGILLGSGRSLRGLKAAENSRKGTAVLPSPCERVRPSLRPLHCRAQDWSSRAFFGEHAPSASKPATQDPRVFPTPMDVWNRFGPLALPEVRNRGGAVAANTQKPRPSARPRLRRAFPATLRWGKGPGTAAQASGRAEPTPASPPPPTARQVVSLIWEPSQ